MRPKFFYGYVILALCFANMIVMRGVNGAFGVYYLALLEEFSWSRSDGATVASANFFVYAIASPLVGLAFDRFGPRLLMPLGALLVGVGLVISSFANSLWELYVYYGIITALGQGALSFVGHNELISFWCMRRSATPIRIASMGLDARRSGMLLPLLVYHHRPSRSRNRFVLDQHPRYRPLCRRRLREAGGIFLLWPHRLYSHRRDHSLGLHLRSLGPQRRLRSRHARHGSRRGLYDRHDSRRAAVARLSGHF